MAILEPVIGAKTALTAISRTFTPLVREVSLIRIHFSHPESDGNLPKGRVAHSIGAVGVTSFEDLIFVLSWQPLPMMEQNSTFSHSLEFWKLKTVLLTIALVVPTPMRKRGNEWETDFLYTTTAGRCCPV